MMIIIINVNKTVSMISDRRLSECLLVYLLLLLLLYIFFWLNINLFHALKEEPYVFTPGNKGFFFFVKLLILMHNQLPTPKYNVKSWHATCASLIGTRFCLNHGLCGSNKISVLFVVSAVVLLFTYIIKILLICCQTTMQAYSHHVKCCISLT